MKKYADYLWVLGGELIRRVSTDEKVRKLPAWMLVLKYIDETGGPCGAVRVMNKKMRFTTQCGGGSTSF